MTAGSLMASAAGLQKTLTINTSKKGAEIPKTMYGLFFEDINFGADGGLYAEKIKNRSFEFDYPLQGWKAAGKVEVKTMVRSRVIPIMWSSDLPDTQTSTRLL